jgi:hypothetical protein
LEDILIDLSQSEGGKRLLVNLFDSLDAGHVLAERAYNVVTGLSVVGTVAWPMHKYQIASVIFSQPDDFQFHGPRPLYSPGEWMTVKSMADLLDFIRFEYGAIDADLQDQLGISDPTGPHHGLTDEHYQRFAESLSDEDSTVQFLLARSFPRPDDPSVMRPSPSWFSRWCHCEFRDDLDLPSKMASGRVRDWLGLPYGEDEPLFVIRARAPIPIGEMNAHRPTPLEGFDNPLYKHRTTPDRDSEVCGSTADIVKLRTAQTAGMDAEGGPEIVSRGVSFKPEVYTCEYLGKTPPLAYDLADSPFHQALLKAGQTIEGIIERLLDILRPPPGVRP